jgi:hypothetical protein
MRRFATAGDVLDDIRNGDVSHTLVEEALKSYPVFKVRSALRSGLEAMMRELNPSRKLYELERLEKCEKYMRELKSGRGFDYHGVWIPGDDSD